MRHFGIGLVSLVLAAVNGQARAQDTGKAKFAEGNATQTKERTMSVKVEIPEELLKDRDVWISVIAFKAPTSLWIQPLQISSGGESERVVYLGQDRLIGPSEKFHVCICTCLRGAIKGEGEIKTVDLPRFGVRILSMLTVERTE